MRSLDITTEHCPMTFVRTKLEWERLLPGEELEVLLSEGPSSQDLSRTVRDQGFLLLSESTPRPGIRRLILRRP